MGALRMGIAAVLLPPVLAVSCGGPEDTDRHSRATSQYLSLSEDRAITERTVVLRAEIDLTDLTSVFVASDGSYAPDGDAAASVFVEVDGERVTNEALIDWRGSRVPVEHSFRAIGARDLPLGSHEVQLVAEPIAGSFVLAEGANLSVLLLPPGHADAAQLGDRAGPFDFETRGKSGPDLEVEPLVSEGTDGASESVALAAASASHAGSGGDAMVSIVRGGVHPGTASSSWSVNDIWDGAELTAPLDASAFLPRGDRSTVSLVAAEFPWEESEDTAVFAIEPSATLVVLSGLDVVGHPIFVAEGSPDARGTTWDWTCIGTSEEWPGCPRVGSAHLHASGELVVPAGHEGVVLFAATARVQADGADPGGFVDLWIEIDGVRRGSTGHQELRAPSSISTRTLSASYLSAGDEALAPGRHTVRVLGRATGSFKHVVFARDLPAVWFG